MQDLISICILTFNQLSYTKECLNSLFEYTSPVRSPYEVLIYDNGSTDGTVEYLKELENSGKINVIFSKENKGFPYGNNRLAEIAKGNYICLCNNDVIFTKSWLEKLMRCIRSDEKLAVVSCYTSHSSGSQQVFPAPQYRTPEELQAYAVKFSGEEKYVDFLVFFCALIKRKVWDEIGGLCEKMGKGNYEDNLFNYRALEKGYKLKVAGDCFIHHHGSVTFTGEKKDLKKAQEYASLMARNQRIFLQEIGQYRKISLIMIVGDQENPETLKRCLDSVYEWVDEICIVFNYKGWKNPFLIDKFCKKGIIINKTGYFKTQMIPNMAHRDIFIKWKYLPWTNFSDMRNKSLAMATGEYVIWLDADDILATPAGIRDIILKNPHIDVFKCKILSYTEQNTIETIFHNRLFRRVKGGKSPAWVNRCHEDLSYSMNELAYTHAMTNLTIKHFGYTNVKHWMRKNERNLVLLEQDLADILTRPQDRDLKETKGAGDRPDQRGRLSMIYYGLVNSLIILAATKKDKRATLIKALKFTDDCLALTKPEDPLTAKMWMMRGVICMDSGELLAAKQSMHKAFDEWKQPEAGINLAKLYLDEKNWNKAIEILDEIDNTYKGAYPVQNLSSDPVQMQSLLLEKLGMAWANKAQGCREKPDLFDEYMRKAEAYYRQCFAVVPRVEVVDVLIQILKHTNRWDEAGLLSIQAVNRWPKYWKGWLHLAEYEHLNNRLHTSRVFLQEALRLNPRAKEAMVGLKGKRNKK